jgi:hypothetical protein
MIGQDVSHELNTDKKKGNIMKNPYAISDFEKIRRNGANLMFALRTKTGIKPMFGGMYKLKAAYH